MKNISLQKGFTLIEVLIYITLFGMLMSGAMVAAYQLLQGGETQQAAIMAELEGTFVSRKLAWALAPATGVSVSGGGKIMTIMRPDLGNGSPLVVDGTGERMSLRRGSGPALPLTGDGLALSNVLFEVVPPANGLAEAVHVSFALGNRQFTYGLYLRQ